MSVQKCMNRGYHLEKPLVSLTRSELVVVGHNRISGSYFSSEVPKSLPMSLEKEEGTQVSKLDGKEGRGETVELSACAFLGPDLLSTDRLRPTLGSGGGGRLRERLLRLAEVTVRDFLSPALE
jgi:hypothetical protein